MKAGSADPLQFAASVTADFVQEAAKRNAGNSGKRLLDVGCGDGLVAQVLQERGYKVTAIDGNPDSVARARSLGVEAIHARLEDFAGTPADLILVSRALHHMPPLKTAMANLKSLLAVDGFLIVEDFGYEIADERACQWLVDQVSEIGRRWGLNSDRHKWLTGSKTCAELQQAWRFHAEEKHQISTGAEQQEALFNSFKPVETLKYPYLFRYLCDLLPATAGGAETAAELLHTESELVQQNQLPAIGLRFVLAHK
ncbi:MAG: class I SAM-dependent methyltransferase [Cyanobacteria bacterium SZAS LIN-3]|nr:class I SAM-dependent methyltransferase [Cyanobacteria bacterium SZAS LIN-3]